MTLLQNSLLNPSNVYTGLMTDPKLSQAGPCMKATA